jgi:hypothetical protein
VSEQPSEWVPAFAGQRPPFEKENALAVTHGGYSPRKVDPLAAELVAQVLEEAGRPNSPTSYLLDVTYRVVLHEWGAAAARVQLLREHLMERHDGTGVKPDGEELGASRAYERAVARLQALSSKLGLDPLSRARLGRDVAAGQHDMAQAMAKARAEAERAAKKGQARGA